MILFFSSLIQKKHRPYVALILFVMLAAMASTQLHANSPTASLGAAQALATEWGTLLEKHVNKSGGVNYVAIEKDFNVLEKHLAGYATLDPKALDEQSKKATYINLYNAGMIYNVLKYAKSVKMAVDSEAFRKLTINSIRVDGGNIWNGNYRLKLGGKDLNLDEIEHGLLRRQGNKTLDPWKVTTLDPRIHAAVNCAAVSCPRVREVAYAADNIDKMLDENFREYLSSQSQFKKIADDKLQANSIVYWYYEDFDSHGKEVLKTGGAGDYLGQYIKPDSVDAAWKMEHLRKNFNDRSKLSLKLSSAFAFEYDWLVNDVANKK